MWLVDQWAGCCRVTTQSQKTFLSEAPHRRDLCSLQDGQTVVWRVHCRWRQGLLQRCTLSCLQHGVTNSISAHRCGLTGHQVYYLVLLQCDCKLQVQVSFPFPFLSFAHSNGLRLKGVVGPWLGLAALSNTSAQSVSRITITQLYVSRVTWRGKRTFSLFFFKTPFNCNLDTETFELQSEHFLRWLEPVDPNLCRTPPQIRSFGILSLRRHGIVCIWFEPLDERHEEYNNI